VGWLANFLAERRLNKLKAQVQKDPRPDVFLHLVQHYRGRGDVDTASAYAKRGAARFPDFPALVKERDEIEGEQRKLEIDRLKQRMTSYPNQILYSRLAELYRSANMLNEAIQTCDTGISLFPNYGGTHLILGQIQLERNDLDLARRHIEKAAELDRYNYMALKLLAQVYMKLGKPKDAARRLEDILAFAPGDEAVTKQLIEAKTAAGEPVDQVATPGRHATVEAGRAKLLSRDRQARARGKVLGEAITLFKQIEGVSGAILVDSYGLVIASDLAAGVEEELAGAMITNIFRTTSQSGEDMGIGEFSDGLIEGETGHIHVTGIGENVLAVFASPNAKAGLLHQGIKDFTSKVRSLQ
jgi:predicted regulator of Ras-like GTPase activity (Roadblock/LC7/MglB family)